jgi:hypothetical protein
VEDDTKAARRAEIAMPDFDVQVRLVFRERWRRILILGGEVELTLIYEGSGCGERVYLDGKLWARTSIWSWKIVYPWVEFPLPTTTGDDLPARMDVSASFAPWRFGITDFRFSIAGEELYEERGNEYWFRDDSGRVTNEPYEPDV